MNVAIEEGADKFAATLKRCEFHESEDFKKLKDIAAEHSFEFDVAGLDNVFHFKAGTAEPEELAGMGEAKKAVFRSGYFRGVEREEGLEGVKQAVSDFLQAGQLPLFKPNGTGQSKGIIGFDIDKDGVESESGIKIGGKTIDLEKSTENFLQRFNAELTQTEADFGAGAGYPFMVMPILELAKTENGGNYDLRWACYQHKVDGKLGSAQFR
jgi:hypothetical protein